MPIKREILYPFFLECCSFVTDNYWRNLFEELSYGKCPYGTYISKNFFNCNFKGKDFSYKLDKKDPKTIYEDVYNLLHNRLGLISENERLNKLKSSSESGDDKDIKWNMIKRKNKKEIIIDNYIINSKKKHNLSYEQTSFLKSIILSGLIFKTILTRDINFKDGVISSINGIDFQEGKILINDRIKNYDYIKEKNSDKKKTKRRLSDLWKFKKSDLSQQQDEEEEISF